MYTRIRYLIAFALCLALLPLGSQASEPQRLTLLKAFMQPRLRGTEPSGFAWSRNDKLIAYRWNESGWSYGEIWVMEPTTGEKWRLTDFENVELGLAREANAEVTDPELKKTDKELVEDVHRRGGIGSPVWGVDGKLYVSWDGDIWRINPDKPATDEKGNVIYAKPELFLDLEGWVGGLAFSEDGTKLGFIYDNCFWVCDVATGAMRQVAQGAGGQGQGSFIWSSDGRYIAFSRVDSGGLRQINLVDFISDNIATWPVNRSRPGDTIDRVQIGIADLERSGLKRNEPRMLKLADTGEVYVYDMEWSRNGKYLLVGLLSKDTQSYDLYVAEPSTGRTAKVWSEHDTAWYNRTTEPHWLGDDAIVLCSEKDGWGHLYKLDITSWRFPAENPETPPLTDAGADVERDAGKKDEKPKEEPPDGLEKPFAPTLPAPVQLTRGEWEVTQVYIPLDASFICYGSTEMGPDRRDLYFIKPDGTEKRRISTTLGVNVLAGWAPVRGDAISWDESRAILSSSTTEAGTSYYFVELPGGERSGTIIGGHPLSFYGYRWVEPELVRIANERDGEQFSARIFRPPYAAKEKRPVIISVHGAGYWQTAIRSYEWMDPIAIYMADTLGYIVVDIDYRGSSGYGRKWRTDVFRQLGELEVSDAVSAAHYIINRGEGDPASVGVWGWSYGGFLTNMIMFRAPETFQAGVAVAAVNKWSNYNAWYSSERLGDPNQNKDAYKKSDPITYADKLQGSLLMVHGIRDDNVLFQDFAQLVAKLLEAGKHVDMMVYPEMSHGPSSDENMVHVSETICWYFYKHFGLGIGAQGPDPKDSLETYMAKRKLEREADKLAEVEGRKF
jgi:dipeptidyl aminopeptidase/acylaminoacyl peptidase